ncbi:MAG: hypothetical protein ABJI60_00705 [Kangiellaceae bacterium]
MEDAAFFTSLVINIGFCCIAVVYSKKWYKVKKLVKWQAFTLYGISTLLAALIAGFGLLSIVIDFYTGLGFVQELGHNGGVLISLFQFFIPILSFPLGLIIINWKKTGYLS